MPFVSVKVNPAELRLIREALQELVVLTRAKLLADGYLAPPQEPVLSTVADVSAPSGTDIWKKIEEQRKQERQAEQLAGSNPPPSMDLSYPPQMNDISRLVQRGLNEWPPPEQSDLP